MVVVGLTGGIGSGKSTVAEELVRRGALAIDVDGVAREIMEPGGSAYAGVVERFGPQVVGADGHLDRRAIASVVFSDPVALADLNRLTHPVVQQVVAARVEAIRAAPSSGHPTVVIIDIPLLTPENLDSYGPDVVVVVDAPVETAVGRLVAQRGLDEADARARLAAQISPEVRRALADLVIDNSGDLVTLGRQIEQCWMWLTGLAGT